MHIEQQSSIQLHKEKVKHHFIGDRYAFRNCCALCKIMGFNKVRYTLCGYLVYTTKELLCVQFPYVKELDSVTHYQVYITGLNLSFCINAA